MGLRSVRCRCKVYLVTDEGVTEYNSGVEVLLQKYRISRRREVVTNIFFHPWTPYKLHAKKSGRSESQKITNRDCKNCTRELPMEF